MSLRFSLISCLAILIALIAIGCSEPNEAEPYMPDGNELCCVGVWEVALSRDDDGELAEGACSTGSGCYFREFHNLISGPNDVYYADVEISLHESWQAAEEWFRESATSAGESEIEFTRIDPLVWADESRAWDFEGLPTFGFITLGSVFSFRLQEVTASMTVYGGDQGERRLIAASVATAIDEELERQSLLDSEKR